MERDVGPRPPENMEGEPRALAVRAGDDTPPVRLDGVQHAHARALVDHLLNGELRGAGLARPGFPDDRRVLRERSVGDVVLRAHAIFFTSGMSVVSFLRVATSIW